MSILLGHVHVTGCVDSGQWGGGGSGASNLHPCPVNIMFARRYKGCVYVTRVALLDRGPKNMDKLQNITQS